MDETSPYQPPMTRTSLTREQKFAVRLLSFRDQPLTMWKSNWMQAKHLANLFLVFGLGLLFLAGSIPG
jgi:hypothetical protein